MKFIKLFFFILYVCFLPTVNASLTDCNTYESCFALAKQNNAEAQFRLYIILLDGLGVQKNPNEALKWLKISAEAGLVDAKIDLGLMYLEGRLVEKDEKSAFQLFLEASNSDHTEALYNAGQCFIKGIGTLQDLEKGFEYLYKAAELRDELAQLEVGKCYAKGIGTSKDLIKAYAWLTVAYAGSGTESYASLQQEIFHKLNSNDQKVAETLAQIYLAKYS